MLHCFVLVSHPMFKYSHPWLPWYSYAMCNSIQNHTYLTCILIHFACFCIYRQTIYTPNNEVLLEAVCIIFRAVLFYALFLCQKNVKETHPHFYVIIHAHIACQGDQYCPLYRKNPTWLCMQCGCTLANMCALCMSNTASTLCMWSHSSWVVVWM